MRTKHAERIRPLVLSVIVIKCQKCGFKTVDDCDWAQILPRFIIDPLCNGQFRCLHTEATTFIGCTGPVVVFDTYSTPETRAPKCPGQTVVFCP